MKELDEDLAVAQFIQDERDGAKEGGYLDRSLNDRASKQLSPKELIYDISDRVLRPRHLRTKSDFSMSPRARPLITASVPSIKL